jgi:hypothetical protein
MCELLSSSREENAPRAKEGRYNVAWSVTPARLAHSYGNIKGCPIAGIECGQCLFERTSWMRWQREFDRCRRRQFAKPYWD